MLRTMAKTDPVDQLRTLNEILARSGASEPERAEHARRALDFFSREQICLLYTSDAADE